MREVLDFAEFLQGQDAATWRQFGRNQLARAYGPDEAEYSLTTSSPSWLPCRPLWVGMSWLRDERSRETTGHPHIPTQNCQHATRRSARMASPVILELVS